MGQSLTEEKDPGKEKRVVLVNPLRDHNPERQTRSSISLSRNQILGTLRWWAGRPLEVEFEEHYIYFGHRIYTAMTIKAK